MSTARFQRLLERQADELARLEARELKRVLQAYEDGRRDLQARLRRAIDQLGDDSWTVQHTRVALLQVEAGIRDLEERMGVELDAVVRDRRERAIEHMLQLVASQEAEFRGTGGAIEVRALRRIADEGGLLLHRYSVRRYGAQLIDQMQGVLARGVTSQLTPFQLVDELVGKSGGVFDQQRHRAALIVRMETARAYDEGHQATIEEAAALLDKPGTADPLMRRADETFDLRNNPFSRALHGRLAPVRGEWEVPAVEVQAWAAALGKPASGILWRLDGGAYRGGSYPAHFNDRGRQTPWRQSWGDSGQAELGSGSTRWTGRAGDLPPRRTPERTVAAEEAAIGGLPFENGTAFFSDGSVVTVGPRDTAARGADPRTRVRFGSEVLRRMRGDGNVVVTHNHPQPMPLSVADIRFAVAQNLAEMRACSRKGAWVVRRPPGGWPAGVGEQAEMAVALADLRALDAVASRRAAGHTVDVSHVRELRALIIEQLLKEMLHAVGVEFRFIGDR